MLEQALYVCVGFVVVKEAHSIYDKKTLLKINGGQKNI